MVSGTACPVATWEQEIQVYETERAAWLSNEHPARISRWYGNAAASAAVSIHATATNADATGPTARSIWFVWPACTKPDAANAEPDAICPKPDATATAATAATVWGAWAADADAVSRTATTAAAAAV